MATEIKTFSPGETRCNQSPACRLEGTLDQCAAFVSEFEAFGKEFNPHFSNFLEGNIKDRGLREIALYAVRQSGLRERAFLVHASTDLCGADWKQTIHLAIAAECFIASALTADDVLDRASTRGGMPAVWCRWGDGAAWLVAEMLHALAQSSAGKLTGIVARAFQRSCRVVFEGQFRETLSDPSLRSTRLALELAYKRTGYLVQVCCSGPAQICGSPLEKALAMYGKNVGTAIQLADDIYDFVGDPKMMGKPLLGDLLNAQPNIVLAHALAQGGSTAGSIVREFLGQGVTKWPPNITPVINAFKDLGSIDFGMQCVRSRTVRARNALRGIPEGAPRHLLAGFLDLVALFGEPGES
jgi:octaprenyl-diphosphate synthase